MFERDLDKLPANDPAAKKPRQFRGASKSYLTNQENDRHGE